MSFKEHVPPTLHNAVGTIIATVVVGAAGASYFWLRGIGSVSVPVWLLALVSIIALGVFTWLVVRLRRCARASVIILHSATWGAGGSIVDRSKIRNGALIVRAINEE